MSNLAGGESNRIQPGSRKGSIKQVVGILAVASIATSILRLFANILLAKFLTPQELGTINGISLVLVYGTFIQAGATNGLNRELPFFIGKGDRPRAEELASCSLAWSIGCGLLGCAVCLAWGGWEAIQGHWDLASGLVAYAIVLGLLFPEQYLIATFRTTSEFKKLALVQVVVVAFSFLLMSGVWRFGYLGQCVRLAVTAALMCLLLWKWRPIRVRPRFSWKHLIHLFKVGLPIFAVGYFYAAWRSLDRAYVLKSLGREQLGYYQVSVLLMMAGMSVVVALGQVIYPKMSHIYGKTGDARTVLRIAIRPTLMMACGVLPLLAIGWLILPTMVQWLLPRYTPGIPAARWTLATIWFLCLTPTLNIYNVLKKQVYYGLVIAAGLGMFLVAVPILRSLNDNPIVPYAQAMTVGVATFVLLVTGLPGS